MLFSRLGSACVFCSFSAKEKGRKAVQHSQVETGRDGGRGEPECLDSKAHISHSSLQKARHVPVS